MLKKILNLPGTQTLTKSELRNVKGGWRGTCNPEEECCGVCNCGLSNWFGYPGQLCSGSCQGHAVYAGPGCV